MLRHRAELKRAIEALRSLAFGDYCAADPALVALMIATAALLRERKSGVLVHRFPEPAYLSRRLRVTVFRGRHFMREEPLPLLLECKR